MRLIAASFASCYKRWHFARSLYERKSRKSFVQTERGEEKTATKLEGLNGLQSFGRKSGGLFMDPPQRQLKIAPWEGWAPSGYVLFLGGAMPVRQQVKEVSLLYISPTGGYRIL
jgi:hypothetical protein